MKPTKKPDKIIENFITIFTRMAKSTQKRSIHFKLSPELSIIFPIAQNIGLTVNQTSPIEAIISTPYKELSLF